MTTQGNFWKGLSGWVLVPGLVLLWLLTLNTGHSLAHAPTPTPWVQPLLGSAGTIRPAAHTGYCLNLQGTTANLGRCNGQSSQYWVAYTDATLRPQSDFTRCLNLPTSGSIALGGCTGDSALWYTFPDNTFRPKYLRMGLCLTLPNNVASDGAVVNVAKAGSPLPMACSNRRPNQASVSM